MKRKILSLLFGLLIIAVFGSSGFASSVRLEALGGVTILPDDSDVLGAFPGTIVNYKDQAQFDLGTSSEGETKLTWGGATKELPGGVVLGLYYTGEENHRLQALLGYPLVAMNGGVGLQIASSSKIDEKLDEKGEVVDATKKSSTDLRLGALLNPMEGLRLDLGLLLPFESDTTETATTITERTSALQAISFDARALYTLNDTTQVGGVLSVETGDYGSTETKIDGDVVGSIDTKKTSLSVEPGIVIDASPKTKVAMQLGIGTTSYKTTTETKVADVKTTQKTTTSVLVLPSVKVGIETALSKKVTLRAGVKSTWEKKVDDKENVEKTTETSSSASVSVGLGYQPIKSLIIDATLNLGLLKNDLLGGEGVFGGGGKGLNLLGDTDTAGLCGSIFVTYLF